jgi:hypothetical protein
MGPANSLPKERPGRPQVRSTDFLERQLFSAASASLKIMAGAVLFERHPLLRTVRCSFDNVGGVQMLPMLRWKIAEGEQCVATLVEHSTVFASVTRWLACV